MYCKNCGKPVEDGAKYCQSCGSEIATPEVSTQTNVALRKPDDGIIENFFKLHGRLNRKKFIKRSFAITGLGILCLFPFFAMFDRLEQIDGAATVIGLFCWISTYCITARRLEDLGYGPGAAILVVIVGILCQVLDEESYAHLIKWLSYGQLGFWFYCAIKKGTTGKNQYGEDPLQQG